jgi:nucleoside-triphosphatase THEP1
MSKVKNVSEVWLKASILGSTWASSEIILGSFLHNLRIPFNGNILTMIGFILMISASYKWKDKGLFWRTGLICALMKTISPSAVIFGPMLAIFLESLMLEISVRLLGRNILGFFLGSSLAMSWILVQKVFNMIIFYGFNIVEIYKSLMGFAEKQLNSSFDLVWMPVLILLAIYLLFGIVAVFFGVKIGRGLNKNDGNIDFEIKSQNFDFLPIKSENFPYSIFWLVINFVFLIGMLLLITFAPIYIWAIASLIIVFLWITRYKRAMRQMMKPSFWIFFVLITMFSALSITLIQGNEDKWNTGLMIGLQMNFRAAIVILGFSVIGTELYNPAIRNFFARTSMKQLPVALELAFESLPQVINSLPDVKSFFKNPDKVVKFLIFQAERRFQNFTDQDKDAKQFFIITGQVASGKTRFLTQLIEKFRELNVKTGGFYSPKILSSDITIAYDLVHLTNNERIEFLHTNLSDHSSDIGKYKMNESSFTKACHWIETDIENQCDVMILDEVGRLELTDKGWAGSIDLLLKSATKIHIWAVRNDFAEQVIKKWDLKNVIIIDAENDSVSTIMQYLADKI